MSSGRIPSVQNASTLAGTTLATNITASSLTSLGTSPALTTPTISTTTTNGDILYGTGSGALARLGIGSSGQSLVVASGIPSWATPAGGSFNTGAAAVSTVQSTTSTTYTDLTTSGPAVTVTTGTKALITFGVDMQSNGANIGRTVMAVAVSGATTVAAADANAINLYFGFVATIQTRVGMSYLITGLTAGSNTFTAKYKGEQIGVSISFGSRQISVIDMGS